MMKNETSQEILTMVENLAIKCEKQNVPIAIICYKGEEEDIAQYENLFVTPASVGKEEIYPNPIPKVVNLLNSDADTVVLDEDMLRDICGLE